MSAGSEKPALCPVEGSVGFPPAIPLLFWIIPQTCLGTSCLYACLCFKPEPHHLTSRPFLPTAHDAGSPAGNLSPWILSLCLY